ncbi:MAG: Hsp20/alpha crystallin family protein [Gemmatimonadota bacterium]|nr:Hsp20/alpha crystallin family protein [Gemmatimonadota bacterium]
MSTLVPTRRRRGWTAFPDLEFDGFENRLARMIGEPMWSAEPMSWTPVVDVVESDEALVLTAELPGVEEKDVELEVEGNVLTLKGEKTSEVTKEEGKGDRKVRIWERSYGAFTRSFTLPGTVDVAGIEAHYEKGVLTVQMPKTKEARGRHIEIRPKKK